MATSTTTKGMIFLEPGNRIMDELITTRLGEGAKRPMEPVDIRTSDFDDFQYRIFVDADNRDVLKVFASVPALAELRANGGDEMLARDYPGMEIEPEQGFNLGLQVDVNSVSESPGTLIKKFSELRRNICGAPLDKCFEALGSGSSGGMSGFQIPTRKGEIMYIRPAADRVTVVFSVDFEDTTDRALARVFLTEFQEAKRHVNNCPPVLFSKDPPGEISDASDVSTAGSLVGFISFAIFASHVSTPEKRLLAVTMMQGFRNYLHYHIKCSKSYLHSRMRKRCAELLQVLNRAVPESAEPAEKTTASGKTFKRFAKK